MEALLFSEFAYGRFTPTFLTILSAVFLLSRYRSSRHSLLLGLYLLFIGISHGGFLFAYAVYHPVGAYGWYIASLAPISTVILIQFAYRFPQQNFKKESRIVLLISLIMAFIAMADYYYHAPKFPLILTENHFGSEYYSPFVAPFSVLLYFYAVVLFFRQSAVIAKTNIEDQGRNLLQRIFLPKNRKSRAARNLALLVFLDVLNTSSIAVFMFIEAFSYSLHNLTLNLGFLVIVFLYIVVYLNHANERITFSIRIVGVFMVTLLFVFSIVGYYNIRTYNSQYDERNCEMIKLLDPVMLQIADIEIPERLAFVIEMDQNKNIQRVLQGKYNISSFQSIRFWQKMPKVPELVDNTNNGDPIFDADSYLKNGRFLTQIGGENYYAYLHQFQNNIIVYGFSYINYRKAVHSIVLKLMIGIVTVAFLMIALLPILFYSGLLFPLHQLLRGVKEVNNSNYNVAVDVLYNDEIGYLSESFNKMVQSINQSKMKLEDYAQNLEQKVELRTEELVAANAEMHSINENLIETRDELKKKNTELSETLDILEKTQSQLIEREKMASLGQLVLSPRN